MATWLHGDESGSAVLSGMVWLTRDRDYAEGYAGESGRIIEVSLPEDLRILDLTDIEVDEETDVDFDRLRELLDEAGITVSDPRWLDGEMHQVIPGIAKDIQAAGYDAVAINEWTYGIGSCQSLCLFGARLS